MAKVMVSMPDELLAAVDAEAGRRGTTRSGYLRQLADDALWRTSARRTRKMTEIDETGGGLSGHGGRVAALVKASRPTS